MQSFKETPWGVFYAMKTPQRCLSLQFYFSWRTGWNVLERSMAGGPSRQIKSGLWTVGDVVGFLKDLQTPLSPIE